MNRKEFSDLEIIDSIRKGGIPKEAAIRHLMGAHGGYISTIRQKLSISEEDARDAFTDALLALMGHVERGSFRGDSKISTYLFRIFYNKSVDLVRKNSTNKVEYGVEIPDLPTPGQDILNLLQVREKWKELEGLMERINEKCKKILMDWGFWGYNMEEIAVRNGLKNARSAKNKKYKCMESLMQLIKENKNRKEE